jgi:hypothetical protein
MRRNQKGKKRGGESRCEPLGVWRQLNSARLEGSQLHSPRKRLVPDQILYVLEHRLRRKYDTSDLPHKEGLEDGTKTKKKQYLVHYVFLVLMLYCLSFVSFFKYFFDVLYIGYCAG